jgi:hypothetical protein
MSLPDDLVSTIAALERGADVLREGAERLPERRWGEAPAAGGFCLVEHAWHMADLEREGFGVRLRRLRDETEPFLPDFDGDRAAREREYATRPLAAGIEAFAAARAANLELLASLPPDAWTRAGTQEGVGRLKLRDLPGMMLRHDRVHAAEIAALVGDE